VPEEECEEIRRLFAITERLAPRIIVRPWSVRRLAEEYRLSNDQVFAIIERTGKYGSNPPALPPERTKPKPSALTTRLLALDWDTLYVAFRAGRPIASIAEELGVSTNTVRSYLHRAPLRRKGALRNENDA
jgi:DNA-binding NarL/FixJ family response regulator